MAALVGKLVHKTFIKRLPEANFKTHDNSALEELMNLLIVAMFLLGTF